MGHGLWQRTRRAVLGGCPLFGAAEHSQQCEGWPGTVVHGRLEDLGGFQQWLEGDSPGKGELNSCSQPAVFHFAVAGERKVQRSLLSRKMLLTPDFPLEVEVGEAD